MAFGATEEKTDALRSTARENMMTSEAMSALKLEARRLKSEHMTWTTTSWRDWGSYRASGRVCKKSKDPDIQAAVAAIDSRKANF